MILPTGGPVKVLMATQPVDFRLGIDGLSALVKDQMRGDPFSEVIYVFRARRADRLKLLFWDGSGLCLVTRRLEQGPFHWSALENGVMRLSPAQFSALFEGLDWRRIRAERVRVPAAAQ